MQSFYSRFQASVDKFPSHVAVELQLAHPSSEVITHTYSELRDMAGSIGRWIRESGIQPGARCAIVAANGPRWVAAYLGIMATGAVAVPLDTAFTAKQIAKLLLDSGSTLIFADEKHYPVVQEAITAVGSQLKISVALLEKSQGVNLPTLDEILGTGSAGFKPTENGPEDL